MSFSVTKSSQMLVVPAGPTPSGVLPLSPFDRNPGLRRCLIKTIHVFEQGEKPADVIRRALSKALVHYYPLAGRLVDSDQGDELQVCCNGEGVWFVEATADCTLAEVNHLAEEPLMIPNDELLSPPPGHMNPDDTMTVMIQVIEFKCGGFVLCLAMSHAIADGIGMGQFLKAIGDIARGLEKPAVEPIWCREANLGQFSLEVSLRHNLGLLKAMTIDLSLDHISQLKNEVKQQTGRGCSTFDVLLGKLWQSFAQVIQPAEHGSDHLNLSFAVNARKQLHHVLPQQGLGYYGNCIYNQHILERREKICHASFVEVVDLIRDAKEKLAATVLAKWIKGELEQNPGGGSTNDYTTLLVADWRNLGYNEVDYGWGAPIYASSLPYSSSILPLCCFVRPPSPKQGVRLIAHCVNKEQSVSFLEKMKSIDEAAIKHD